LARKSVDKFMDAFFGLAAVLGWVLADVALLFVALFSPTWEVAVVCLALFVVSFWASYHACKAMALSLLKKDGRS
jgi:hypothetical protein